MPLTDEDRGLLSRAPLFSSFTGAEVSVLAEYGVVREYDTGQVIIWAQAENRSLRVLLSGAAVVTIQIRGDVESVLAHLTPGAHFGELTFIDGRPASGNVTTEAPSRVLELPIDRMQALLDEKSPLFGKLAWAMLRDLAGKLRATNDKVQDAVIWGLDAAQLDPS